MKMAWGLGLVLLTVAAPNALAGIGPSTTGEDGNSALFLFSASGAPSARGTQGYLGVSVRDVSGDQVNTLKLKDTRGAEIVLVDHDAPAGKAGLREHDVVLQMNGQAIEGRDQLSRMLHETAPGKTITLLISRDGQQITVTTQMAVSQEQVERQASEQHLTVLEPSAQSDAAVADPTSASSPAQPLRGGNSFMGSMLMNSSYTGAMLEKMSSQLAEFFGVPNGAGLLVRSVQENSPAAFAGMHAGDVVVRANANPVTTTADWAKAIKNSHGRPLNIVVMRDKKEQTLTLTPDGKKRSSLTQPMDNTDPVALAHLGMYWIPRHQS